jgi:hypothetical protein
MQWITVAAPPFDSIDSIDQFDAVLARMAGEPDGLEASRPPDA